MGIWRITSNSKKNYKVVREDLIKIYVNAIAIFFFHRSFLLSLTPKTLSPFQKNPLHCNCVVGIGYCCCIVWKRGELIAALLDFEMEFSVSLAELQRRINNFEFVEGKTPLSTIYHVVGAVSLYLLVCFFPFSFSFTPFSRIVVLVCG